MKDSKKKVEVLKKLIEDLPVCNRTLLSWIFVHMGHIIERVRTAFLFTFDYIHCKICYGQNMHFLGERKQDECAECIYCSESDIAN